MPRIDSRWAAALAASAVLAFAALGGAADEPAFVPIFNGKDLTGWEGDKALWSVVDGAITGVTTDEKPLKYNKFLIYRGSAPKNFELKAKVRLKGNSNSGIQYRSKQLTDAGDFVVAGYQMDIHPSPNYNAMLYDERGRGILAEVGQKTVIGEKGALKKTAIEKPAPVKLDEWNDYAIIAKGNHLTHLLNGKPTIEVIDHQESQRELEGIIALQVHVGPAMTVQFKDVMLKNLPDGGIIAPEKSDAKAVGNAQAKAKAKGRPRPPAGPAPPPTPVAKLKTLPGFKVELVHQVSRDGEGSWVSMAIDPKNRLIVSDQYGKLYRVTPSSVGGDPSETKVEPIDVAIGEAQGLLWAFDSLYVVVNRGEKYDSGLYRVKDTDGDDKLDKVELLRKLDGGGEHGPHAVVLAPDKKSLYIVAGNATALPKLAESLVPRIYGEDSLLPYMTDGAGFMRDEKAPGGWVCKVDPEGKDWELVASGFRNAYDMAFNPDGELFTYDSDMEWDMNLPWYRPTRVCHVVSAGEFGYRNGSGKWPTYYLDSLPPVADIGPGSPTGVTFGSGSKFPAKYQDALFICDWSYGKLYALHMKPKGSSFGADVEEFLSGSPLPLTDLLVSPKDGALYFAIGGRRTTSGLYRVVYDGKDATAASKTVDADADARKLRHKLEAFHGHADPAALAAAWPELGNPDRFIAYAARVAIEWQDPSTWREKALKESDPAKALPALLALTRVSAKDPAHRAPNEPNPDPKLAASIFKALGRVAKSVPDNKTLDLVRVYQVALNRLGKPDAEASKGIVARLDSGFPGKSRERNVEVGKVLVFLEAPTVAEKLVGLLEGAPTQEEQIQYATTLRTLKAGWTPELRKRYFSWFPKAADYKGGNSFGGFMRNIRQDSASGLNDQEKATYQALLDAKPSGKGPAVPAASRPFVKEWKLEELEPIVEEGLKSKRDFDRGRTLFAATSCFSCHRFNNEGGGAGPELTGVAGRFSTHDLLESIIKPSKVISDQYGAVMISTTDGRVVTGRIVNLNNNGISVNTNMLDPNLQVGIDRNSVEEMKPSPISMMPEGLLNTLKQDEILDLIAYLMSRGDRNQAMFQ